MAPACGAPPAAPPFAPSPPDFIPSREWTDRRSWTDRRGGSAAVAGPAVDVPIRVCTCRVLSPTRPSRPRPPRSLLPPPPPSACTRARLNATSLPPFEVAARCPAGHCDGVAPCPPVGAPPNGGRPWLAPFTAPRPPTTAPPRPPLRRLATPAAPPPIPRRPPTASVPSRALDGSLSAERLRFLPSRRPPDRSPSRPRSRSS